MNNYSWPASVTMTRDAVVLTFPDWPDLSESGASVQEAMLRATETLSKAALTRIHARATIPKPSDLGPRQIPIAIDAETSAQLDGYLEERQVQLFRETKEWQQAFHNRRAAFLTEFRASIDPIERIIERVDAGATEFAAMGVRFCYILNAGGLVAVPAIMEIMPDAPVDRTALLWPTGAFVVGVLLAAVTNYFAYRSMFMAGEGWSHERNARAKETSGIYYPPENQATHEGEIAEDRGNLERKLKSATDWANIAIGTFSCAILVFLFGVGSAIHGLW